MYEIVSLYTDINERLMELVPAAFVARFVGIITKDPNARLISVRLIGGGK